MLLTPPSMRLLLNFDNFLSARLKREIITKQQMHQISCLASDDSYIPSPRRLVDGCAHRKMSWTVKRLKVCRHDRESESQNTTTAADDPSTVSLLLAFHIGTDFDFIILH